MTTKYNSLMLWVCALASSSCSYNTALAINQTSEDVDNCLNDEMASYLVEQSKTAPSLNLAEFSYLDWLWVRPENWEKIHLIYLYKLPNWEMLALLYPDREYDEKTMWNFVYANYRKENWADESVLISKDTCKDIPHTWVDSFFVFKTI